MNFLMNCIAFWTLETFAAQLIVRWASDLLSGQIIPLTFFPGHARAARLRASVCGHLLDAAADLRRHHSAGAMGVSIAVQGVWLVLFAVLSSVVWRAAANRVVIQGG